MCSSTLSFSVRTQGDGEIRVAHEKHPSVLHLGIEAVVACRQLDPFPESGCQLFIELSLSHVFYSFLPCEKIQHFLALQSSVETLFSDDELERRVLPSRQVVRLAPSLNEVRDPSLMFEKELFVGKAHD